MWKINRKLAIVHVSGYGQTGPDKNKAAYDVSGQAMGGYMYMNGTSPTSPPLKVNPYLSDYATAYNACICALSIMTNARITGEGDACDVSQYETMFRLLGSYPAEWFNKGYPGPGEPVKYRTGNVSDIAAGFSFYDCKDGGTIFIGMVGAGGIGLVLWELIRSFDFPRTCAVLICIVVVVTIFDMLSQRLRKMVV